MACLLHEQENSKALYILADRGWEFRASAIQDMRNWVSDCVWGDVESDEDLSDEEIILGVSRKYDGGLLQFLKDATLI